MGNIVLLDDLTINQIAAGEVIERPASAIKEMLENSIDAGARNVTIEVKNGGISLIRITADGSGIAEDDMEIAFERHATSKIRTAADLQTVKSMGFRGEALASIAAIAKVEMVSKKADSAIGNKIVIEGGDLKKKTETGCPNGTKITVENLFYNTPVRYKFLKKDYTEAGYIEDVVTRIALVNKNVSITLINNGKTILHTPGNGDMKSIIYSVYGKDIANGIIDVDYVYENMRVTGVVGKAEIAKGNRGNQLFFVNNRFVKDKTLTAAVDQAYKDIVSSGRFAFVVLNIDMDPKLVDVNVHPAKLEVRFQNESLVFKAIYHAIKASLGLDNAKEELNNTNSNIIEETQKEIKEDKENNEENISKEENIESVNTIELLYKKKMEEVAAKEERKYEEEVHNKVTEAVEHIKITEEEKPSFLKQKEEEKAVTKEEPKNKIDSIFAKYNINMSDIPEVKQSGSDYLAKYYAKKAAEKEKNEARKIAAKELIEKANSETTVKETSVIEPILKEKNPSSIINQDESIIENKSKEKAIEETTVIENINQNNKDVEETTKVANIELNENSVHEETVQMENVKTNNNTEFEKTVKVEKVKQDDNKTDFEDGKTIVDDRIIKAMKNLDEVEEKIDNAAETPENYSKNGIGDFFKKLITKKVENDNTAEVNFVSNETEFKPQEVVGVKGEFKNPELTTKPTEILKEAVIEEKPTITEKLLKQKLSSDSQDTLLIDTMKVRDAIANSESNKAFDEMYKKAFGVDTVSVRKEKEQEEKELSASDEFSLPNQENESVFENSEISERVNYRFVGVVFDNNVIIEMANEMFIIDQEAAQEKIFFETVKNNYFETDEKDIQTLLLPDIITLNRKEDFIAKQNFEMFENAGFIFEEFGENTIKLVSVPGICEKLNTKQLFLEILKALDTVAITAKKEKEEKFISVIAAKCAEETVPSNDEKEIDEILQKLLKIENPFICKSGRVVAIKLTRYDLEKKFSRDRLHKN